MNYIDPTLKNNFITMKHEHFYAKTILLTA